MEAAVEAIVLAGGGGERFWPRSRAARPKQFLPLLEARPMLAVTAARVAPLVSRTWVVTRRDWVALAREILPGAEILGEPCGRSTAAALALVAARVAPETVLLALPSDHAVDDAEGFREVLASAAASAAAEDSIVCLGLAATRPETGYGWIRPGAARGAARRIAAFEEKPARARAEELFRAGCLWNGGIFAFRGGVLLEEIRRHMPDLAAALPAFASSGPDLNEIYERLPSLSIDKGVLEKTDRALVVRADVAWDDVGDWTILERSGRRAGGNAVGRGELVAIGSEGVIAETDDGIVAVVGVKDLVVVRDGGVVLVAAKGETARIREILSEIRKNPSHRIHL